MGRCGKIREKDKETERKIGSERHRTLPEATCPCRAGLWGHTEHHRVPVKAMGPVIRPLGRGSKSNTAS